jgi:hypothetical protein
MILSDGSRFATHISHARGSLERPMDDSELDTKFRDLAGTMLPADMVEGLRQSCRNVAGMVDVGNELGALLP